ncbi:35c1da24-d878-4ad9-81d7-a648cc2ed064 [Sclerotinia trifoliorum]|uniref:glutathione transferase n=1 Tax=Sclerotinia trifoliorum TaxID=28548 RepID=A0A8H2VPA3_9HELO|nr:35c1da24-d878-4ad9-81d7-a648cc2ed064 [Sclerotinia trifoliorum]
MTKPIEVWMTAPGPNSWKASTNTPTIKDPNTNLTLWESGAMVLYLVEHYDKEKKLTYESLQERAILTYGSCFGQCVWFNALHSEKVASAIKRYYSELGRILAVLDSALTGKE